ncbi:hypothetical protein EKK58_05320 [Candidatus Dependentiae bacterium]|nr:MAG: hypothetical protein EKK58_05320 [Candidatus Dependentiae bacterium]
MVGRADEQWSRLAQQANDAIDVSKFPLRIVLKIRATENNCEFEIGIIAMGREGEPTTRPQKFAAIHNVSYEIIEQFAMCVSFYQEDRDAAVLGVLVTQGLDLIRKVVLHELDECTLVRGIRLYDPHTERRRFDAHP